MRKAIIHRVRDVGIALWHAAECAIHRVRHTFPKPRASAVGQSGRDIIIEALSKSLSGNSRLRQTVAVLVLEIDDFRRVEEAHDIQSIEILESQVFARMQTLLREKDVLAQLEGPRFAIALSPHRRLDLEAAVQLATRVQHSLAEPFTIENRSVHITGSIGFALANRLTTPSAATLLRAANIALLEAFREGPNAVRSYSAAMHNRIVTRDGLLNEAQNAIETSQITAFFQPQIDLQTEKLTGFEALARWQHPVRGLIPPSDFLPTLEQAGLMRQLGHRMLSDSLAALAKWDEVGLHVPTVSINLSNVELRNPNLVEHVMMELDRFHLSANRLVVEVLETVVASQAAGMINTNLTLLAKMGCGIDLDDFGTGHASITSIRKLAIHRIKIDRSFVTNVDQDTEQQNMASAILTMADRLGLETLAEGVETAKEQIVLAAMGCGHMQGYYLAKPMDFDKATDWISNFETLRREARPLLRAL